jgi:hypothetical protein
VSRSGDKQGAVHAGDASERGPRRKGKGKKGALRLGTCRGAEQAGRAGRSRESCGGERREEEGKADKRAPLVSCPSGKVKGRVSAWWIGPCGPCAFRGERRGSAGLGYVLAGWWAMCVLGFGLRWFK